MARDPDLRLPVLPTLRWSSENARESVDQVRAWAESLAEDSVSWYMTEKRSKARWSRNLRRIAAVLVTAGGAVPIAALASGRAGLGNWGFVLLGVAAGCLAYDRFFGYSSAWQRYMSCAITLRAQLAEFRLLWTAELVRLGDDELSREDSMRLVELARAFVVQVNETIRAETDTWLAEFHARVSELETRLLQPDHPT